MLKVYENEKTMERVLNDKNAPLFFIDYLEEGA